MIPRLLVLFPVLFCCSFFFSCTPREGSVEGNKTSGSVYSPPPPSRVDQAVEMQEALNRINRSLAGGF